MSPDGAVIEARVAHLHQQLERVCVRLLGLGMMFRWVDPIVPAGPDALEEIDALERLVGPLPPALVAWWTRVEAVDLSGWLEDWHGHVRQARGTWPQGRFFGDPLTIRSPAEAQALLRNGAGGRVPFSPHCLAKERTGREDLYLSWTPGDRDAVVDDGTQRSFLDYVEESVAWLGYPGWARYEDVPLEVELHRKSKGRGT